MTERFVEKFFWRVIIMHLVLLAVFFFSVRSARGDTGESAPAAQSGQCRMIQGVGGHAGG